MSVRHCLKFLVKRVKIRKLRCSGSEINILFRSGPKVPNYQHWFEFANNTVPKMFCRNTWAVKQSWVNQKFTNLSLQLARLCEPSTFYSSLVCHCSGWDIACLQVYYLISSSDNLTRIRIRTLNYRSGSWSCSFHQWLSRWQQKIIFFFSFFAYFLL